MADAEPVNRAAFEALVQEMGDDPAFVADLVDSYVDNARLLVEGMHEAVRKGEPADLVRLAHELKSTSAGLGADHLSSLCGDLEARARNDSLSEADRRVAEIEAQAIRTQAALRDLADRE